MHAKEQKQLENRVLHTLYRGSRAKRFSLVVKTIEFFIGLRPLGDRKDCGPWLSDA